MKDNWEDLCVERESKEKFLLGGPALGWGRNLPGRHRVLPLPPVLVLDGQLAWSHPCPPAALAPLPVRLLKLFVATPPESQGRDLPHQPLLLAALHLAQVAP